MPYKAPYIDNDGIHISSYEDILDFYQDSARSIFGTDIYLENDSLDHQMLSILARAAYETSLTSVVAYNSRAPRTSFDDALDGIVTINGIERKQASYSTVTLSLTGAPYTQIVGGVAQSVTGSKWSLPDVVTLNQDGIASVSATAQELGAVTALPGEINIIATPTYGWASVNNPNGAFVGQSYETNAELKTRREEAVATPGQTTLQSLKAGVSSILGVTDYDIVENYTNVTDERGLPGHSISAVVEGGSDEDIAEMIALRKNEGVYTYGDQSVDVTDFYGTDMTIRFFRPNYREIYTTLTIKALKGYSSDVANQIKQAIVDYFGKLKIGSSLYISQIWEAALSVSPDVRPYFSLRNVVAGESSENLTNDDILATFKDKFTIDITNIAVNVES